MRMKTGRVYVYSTTAPPTTSKATDTPGRLVEIWHIYHDVGGHARKRIGQKSTIRWTDG